MTKLRWRDMISEGLTTKRGKEQTWSQLIMAANTPMLLRAGLVEGDTRAGVLASGQVVGMLDDLPTCRDLIEQIVAEAEAIIGKLPSVLS
jgi:NAD(P)H-dependent flavin oxidoreductase YrpB (nitropropane dioxygenase family)